MYLKIVDYSHDALATIFPQIAVIISRVARTSFDITLKHSYLPIQ